jgi:glucokinase
MAEKCYIGVDLGGTNLKAGVVSPDARVLAKTSVPTQAHRGADFIIDNISKAIEDVRAKAGIPRDQVAGVGIGTPGTLDIAAGVVHYVPNMPLWRDVSVVERVVARTGYRVVLENDANAAAYGEYWVGAGRGVSSMVMLTLGTGIGSGIIANGRLIHGDTDCAGEIGHMVIEASGVKCACGNFGCLEAYASANSLVRRFREAIVAGEDSCLAEAARGTAPLEAKAIYEAATAGDMLANRIFHETAVYLGIGIVNVLHIINPARVVIAGGLINAGELLMGPVRRAVKERALPDSYRRCDIVFASLGEDAGFIGGAGCASVAFEISR